MSAKPPPEGADLTEATVASRLVYPGGFLRVHRDEIRLPDGRSAWREWVGHPGAVMMLPFLDERTVLLERQYRYPLRRHFIEIPAGKLEPDEAALATARRELVEECGYEAAEWRHLATLHPCIAYSDEAIEFYACRDLAHVGSRLDAGEHLEVLAVDLGDALAWVRAGIITDTKTTFGLLWWAQWGAQAWDAPPAGPVGQERR